MSQSSKISVRNFYIYLIFLGSGFAALIYQVIWARWLILVFGNTSISIALVLGSFMLGLVLGSWWVGKRLHKISDPLLMYAYLEIGIGIFALFFLLLTNFTDSLFRILIDEESSLLVSVSLRAAFSFLLLVIPTSLMGATLPLLTDFFHRRPGSSHTWRVGHLYAANTLGAAIGTIVAGFFLIEFIGIRSTTLFAAFINLFVGLLGYHFSRILGKGTGALREPGPLGLHKSAYFALGVLIASGCLALMSEVLWTRTLEILIGNSTYAFSMILVIYLTGIAAGSHVLSLFVDRLKSPLTWLIGALAAMGGWVLVAMLLFNRLSSIMAKYNLMSLPISTWVGIYLQGGSILFPLAFFSGAVFPLATRIMNPGSEDAQGNIIAKAYAWNTSGAVAGSLLAGFVIAPFFSFFHSLFVLGGLYGLAAILALIFCFVFRFQATPSKFWVAVLAVCCLFVVGVTLRETIKENYFVSRFQNKFAGLEVVFHKPGLQGITSVVKKKEARFAEHLFVNGVGMTRKILDTKMMAHLPMLLHPSPEDTLIICFGMGTTYRSAISHGKNVTVVELVDEVYEAFDFFYEDADQVRKYERGAMITNDGRIYLQITKKKYDVITIDPPPPIDGAGVNHLYSKEFVEIASRKLKKDGIFAHWVPFPGSKAGVEDQETFEMLLATVGKVFPYTIVLPGFHHAGMHVLGSRSPISINQEALQRRLKNEMVLKDLNEWGQIPLSYFSDFRTLHPSLSDNHPILTDDNPVLEFYLIRFWLQGKKKARQVVLW